jgi:hypothetical protein
MTTRPGLPSCTVRHESPGGDLGMTDRSDDVEYTERRETGRIRDTALKPVGVGRHLYQSATITFENLAPALSIRASAGEGGRNESKPADRTALAATLEAERQGTLYERFTAVDFVEYAPPDVAAAGGSDEHQSGVLAGTPR